MQIHAIQTGTVAVRTKQRRGEGRGPQRLLKTLIDSQWTPPLPIYAWVIDHPEGIIVVDTGETAATAEPGYFPRWHPYFRLGVREWVSQEEEIGPQLRKLGISPADVRWVIMTHLHTDHAGGLHHFPDSEILVGRTEYEAATGLAGRVRGYLNHRWPRWFKPRLVEMPPVALGPFPRSLTLTESGDVHLVPTPGHASGHLSVIVEGDDRTYFLAGDTSYTEQLMLQQHVDGVAPDEAAARQTLQRILRYVQEQPTVYLPSHDPDAARRLATGAIVQPAQQVAGRQLQGGSTAACAGSRATGVRIRTDTGALSELR